MSNLVASLRNHGVPVTGRDRDELRRLLDHLKEPTEDVDRLNVVD